METNAKPRLLARFEDELVRAGYSPRTVRAYLSHARGYLDEVEPGAADLGESLRRHVERRTANGSRSRAYHDQLMSALRLFCARVLGRRMEELPLARPPRERRPPSVLDRDELRRFLGAVGSPKHVAILAVTYSAGLRVGEVVSLRPADLDRERGLIRVRGQDGRERHTLLARAALAALDAYLGATSPGHWLFPGARPGAHLSTRSVQKATRRARLRAGIAVEVTPSVLRHSFAAHLVEGGTDIRLIQELLGHASARTTGIYARVSERCIERVRSPLDGGAGE